MLNSTQFSYFKLAAYFDTGILRYFYFLTLLLLYICIVGSNVLLIVVICMNRSLHEPMYMFLCSMFVNELFGSTALFPFLLLQILSDVHTVSAPFCFLQIFCLYTYGGVEYYNLAVMSYDRYLAICYPLHYNTRMTCNKTATLIAVTWASPFLLLVVMIWLSSSLQLCGNIIDKVYCDNYAVVKLACSDTTVSNMYELVAAFATVLIPFTFIFYSYIKILKVCLSGSEQTRQKAVSTCTPHLAILVNFSFGACLEALQSRFPIKGMPNMLRIFLSTYYIVCLPLFNPVLYGLNMSKIRVICKGLISRMKVLP